MRTTLNISYTEAMAMPVAVRDDFLDKLIEDWNEDAKLFKKMMKILAGSRRGGR